MAGRHVSDAAETLWAHGATRPEDRHVRTRHSPPPRALDSRARSAESGNAKSRSSRVPERRDRGNGGSTRRGDPGRTRWNSGGCAQDLGKDGRRMTLPDKHLDELMRECGSGVPPDYPRFYLALDEIMGSGIGPRSFCMVLVAKLRQVMKVIEDFSQSHRGAGPADVDDATKRELLVAYNGFKLLQGFIGDLPGEMQDLIAQATGIPTMGGGNC